MGFSAFDNRLLETGLAWFDQPRLATLLEQLGTNRFQRLEALTAMLRNGASEEIEEAVALFERVLERVDAGDDRRRRRESAAERRRRRHRST